MGSRKLTHQAAAEAKKKQEWAEGASSTKSCIDLAQQKTRICMGERELADRATTKPKKI